MTSCTNFPSFKMINGKIDASKEIMVNFEDEKPCPRYGSSHWCDKAKKHFVKFFLDTSFFLCVFPYRIVEVEGECAYKKKRFIPQQILCAFLHFIAIWDAITEFRQFDLSRIAQSPRLYFDIFTTLVHTSVILSFSYTMWRKGDLFCRLVQTVQRCPIVSLWYPKWINVTLSLVAIQFAVMALLCPVFMTGKDQKDTWKSWYDYHVLNGRYSLFLTPDNLATEEPNLTKVPALQFPDVLFFIFSYFLQLTEWIFIAQFGLIMLVMSLTLYCATNHFVGSLRRSDDCKLTLRNYESLKYLSGVINSINGTVTLTYTVDCIMYFSTTTHTVFTGSHWFLFASFITFLISSVAWLHFASYACLQMDRFRDWVRQKENRSLLPSKSIAVILLLDEISTNVVGISGHGLFTVNYKFVAQAMTTLMTYFIIVIQFK